MEEKKEPLLFTRGGSGADMLPQMKAMLKKQLSQSHPFLSIDLDESTEQAQNAERHSK